MWLLALGISGGWDVADPVASVVGALAGVAGLAYALVALLDAEQSADRLAGEVVRREQTEYVRWLDGSTGGRIDLAYTALVHGQIEGAPAEGRLSGLTALHQRLSPPRMVITGAEGTNDAGIGKSLAALSIVLDLARDREPGQPVPLRMAAASWTSQDLEDCLVQHLVTAFGVGSGPARRLVEARLVLPVVDGLDELDPPGTAAYHSRAAGLVRLLNAWQHGTQPAAAVVTCRRGVYDGLLGAEAHLRDTAVVRLAPVEAEQSVAFLRRSVADTEAGLSRWQPVLDALASAPRAGHVPDSPAAARLRQVLTTPWRLSLVVAVYQERTADGRYRRDPADLLALAESGTLHQHLLGLYVPTVLAARGDGTVDPDGPARRWLTVLASYLDDNRNGRQAEGRTLSATDLVLPDLWPMVGARRTKRAIRWACLCWAVMLELMVVVRAALTSWEQLGFSFMPLLSLLLVFRPDLWEGDDRMVLRPRRFALGCALGSVPLVLLGLFDTSSDSTAEWAMAAAAFGLMAGGAMGVAVAPDERQDGPRALVRSDAVSWALLLGDLVAIFALLGYGMAGWRGLALVLLPLALVGALVSNSLSLRYVVFLVLARRILPWRLGRFLHACHQAGILRTAGAAYQFRRRELQDYLARR
ncbi:NACHT domain-containing protein [Streptomyces sp. TLI_105]|uniref:NACHT domain-containing protein n=1 Tax=Streptomyces sp. TLI_105 TaxID=1881019 RepID=UPI00115FA86E|nr:NACHT domain-containing protein [Streptomyces sp. TLI_105]